MVWKISLDQLIHDKICEPPSNSLNSSSKPVASGVFIVCPRATPHGVPENTRHLYGPAPTLCLGGYILTPRSGLFVTRRRETFCGIDFNKHNSKRGII